MRAQTNSTRSVDFFYFIGSQRISVKILASPIRLLSLSFFVVGWFSFFFVVVTQKYKTAPKFMVNGTYDRMGLGDQANRHKVRCIVQKSINSLKKKRAFDTRRKSDPWSL